jgi:glycosyltransferase involved in cell wall biosynthesis
MQHLDKPLTVLFLSKRRPMQRDLLTQPYGRFYHLPRLLAERGHRAHVLLLSYRNDSAAVSNKDGVTWESISVFRGGLSGYLARAKQIMRFSKPDWVVGFSDTYYGILAQRLAARYGARSAIDAYDNLESYLPWCKPLHWLWRKSLARATLATAAGPNLAKRLAESRPSLPTVLVPMAADPPFFQAVDRQTCRKILGLPDDNILIGYCGSIHKDRGIEVLFAAYKKLRQKRNDVRLVISGRLGRGITLPSDIHWLGYMPNEAMVTLLGSLDVLTVMIQPSEFGNYSYPVKLYEAMCGKIPVVVTETASTRWMLTKHPDFLVPPNDPQALCDAIERAASLGRVDYGPQPDWQANVDILEKAFLANGQSY